MNSALTLFYESGYDAVGETMPEKNSRHTMLRKPTVTLLRKPVILLMNFVVANIMI